MNLTALVQTIRNLDGAWGKRWPGLPLVYGACVHQLNGQASVGTQSARIRSLLGAGEAVAQRIEGMGRAAAAQKNEPAYHSRLHTATTLVSLTALLLAQRQVEHRATQGLSPSEARMLLAMVAHDAGHPGRINTVTHELEGASYELVAPLLKKHGVNAEDTRAVKDIILSTDPRVGAQHYQTAHKTTCSTQRLAWQRLFVQEADVLASALPQLQAELTRQLAKEWAKFNKQAAAGLLKPSGRLGFLEGGTRFSTPAARSMGIDKLVAKQIAAIRTSGA